MAKAKAAAGTKPAASNTPKADTPEEKIEPTSGAAAPAGPVDQGETAPVTPVPEQPTENAALAVPAAPAVKEAPSLEAAKDGDAVEGLWIRSVPPSIRRAGYRFTREGVGFSVEAAQELFSWDQVEQLRTDPDLVIEECTFIDGEAQR